jgi:hypothetical protein
MRFFLISICAYILFFLPGNTQAQYWRTFTNPLYNAHWKLNENQYLKSQKILQKRASTPDTLNPIFWHSLTRIAEFQDQPDSAIYYARKSVVSIQILQKNTELYAEFLRIYILDAYYLDLYYRKLLYQKYHTQRSTSSPTANNKLLGFYLQESQGLAQSLPLTNINRRITLPLITENLNALNDTIAYNRVIQTKNTQKTWNYLQELGNSDPQIQQLPVHLKSFYISARDSFYSWTYEDVLIKHNEQEYLNFIQKFPSAPQVKHALLQADELAFAQCRNAHSAPIYTAYLEKYPYGKYRKQAKMLLRYLTVVPVPYARADGKYIFVDSMNMRPWIDSAYDFAYPFCLKHHKKWATNAATLISGCALVMKKDEFDRNQWYFIEKDGTPYNDKRYDEIRQLSREYAIVSLSNRHGLIDGHGRELLPPIFERIFFDTQTQVGTVFNGEFWALFNQYGKRISKFEYNEIITYLEESKAPIALPRFENNRILVRKENSLLVLDFEGNQRFLGTFTQITPFLNYLAVATLPNKRQLLIDTNGNALSDTFISLVPYIPGQFYQAQLPSKKPQYAALHIAQSQPKLLRFRSESPIEFARYWDNPHFLSKINGEWHIHNAQDSLVFKSKTGDFKSHAQTLFISLQRKNPKLRNSPWVKKWFNPYSHSFSSAASEEIGVLQNKRIVLYDNNKALLYKVDETPLPIFHESKSTPDVSNIREIFRINRNDLLMVRTDSSQTLIDLNGKMQFDFTRQTIEEITPPYFLQSRPNGQFLITENNKTIIGPFDEINEEGFEGYYLLNKTDKWIWVDAKKRWFGELE